MSKYIIVENDGTDDDPSWTASCSVAGYLYDCDDLVALIAWCRKMNDAQSVGQTYSHIEIALEV